MIVAPGRTLYRSPYDNPAANLLALVAGARKSIHVIAYALGLEPFVDLLIAKHMAGLDVGLVLDRSESLQPWEAPLVAKLQAAGVPCAIGVSPVHHAIIHTKMALIDGKVAVYGSANFTAAGLNSEQNISVFDRSKAVLDGLEAYYQQVLIDTRAHPTMEDIPV